MNKRNKYNKLSEINSAQKAYFVLMYLLGHKGLSFQKLAVIVAWQASNATEIIPV